MQDRLASQERAQNERLDARAHLSVGDLDLQRIGEATASDLRYTLKKYWTMMIP